MRKIVSFRLFPFFKKINTSKISIFFFIILFPSLLSWCQPSFDSFKKKILTEMGFFQPVIISVTLSWGLDKRNPNAMFLFANGYFDLDYKNSAYGAPKCIPSEKLKSYVISIDWPEIYKINVGKRVIGSITYKNAWTEFGQKLQSFKFIYHIEPVLPGLPRLGPFQGLGVGIWNPAIGEWHAYAGSSLEDMGSFNLSSLFGGAPVSLAYEEWITAQETQLKKKVEALMKETELKQKAPIVPKESKFVDKEIMELEAKVKENPSDRESLLQLLRNYKLKSFESESARKGREQFIIWLIQNHPEEEIWSWEFPEIFLSPQVDGEAYYQAKNLWLKQVEDHKKNTNILYYAARFVSPDDSEIKEKLLREGQSLEPKNYRWSDELGHLYYCNMITQAEHSLEDKEEAANKALQEYERCLSFNIDADSRLYLLVNAAKSAIEAENIEKAEAHAVELMNKAAVFKNGPLYEWALHIGRQILGRVVLRRYRRNDFAKADYLQTAKEFLINSAKISSSNEINFVPSMALAKELLEIGEREIVINYLELYANVWKDGKDRLKEWREAVRKGNIPDFRLYLY